MSLLNIDFFGIKIENRDFQGKKFGPQYRTFAVCIEDEDLIEQLRKLGVKIWYKTSTNDDPDRTMISVRVDNRFNDVKIVFVDSDDVAIELDPENPDDAKCIDEAWIDDAQMHIEVSEYQNSRTGAIVRTPFLKTLFARLLPEEEVKKRRANNESRRDPVRERNAKYFNR